MKYDVFLSHNSSDKPHVRALHDWLSRNGVRSFLDENDLEPGDVLTDALGVAMDESSSAIICIGEHGEGPWHGEEMNTLLGRSLKMARTQNEFRLIPVLLPDADTTTMRWFLQTRLWVDLSRGITGADAELFRLKAAIMGEKGAPVNLDSDLNPYRGLEAFRVEDGRFFFGRSRESVELAEKVRRSRFCVITGPSGNGKSSLARAGLNSEAALKVLPELAVWKRVTFKPGQGFLRSLLLQLHSHLPSEQRGPLVDKAIASIMPPVGLPTADSWAEAVNQHLEAFFPGDDETVLLLVDQFEEIFTHRGIGTATESDRLDRARLVMDGLATLRERGNRRWRILLTVRSDFYQRCRVSEAFWSLLEKEHLRLELDELNEDGWREAIKGPASRAGAYLEAGLVETMMKDVYRQRGSMPLLQLALQSLWNLREGACLTHAAYLKVGGVTNALQQRAESCLENLKDENSEYFAIARNLLLRLVSPGEGVGDTRRRAERREFEWENTDRLSFDYVLQELTSTENRLLVTDGDSVEIVHEVLIRDCPTIRGWIELARPEIPMLRRLTHAAYRWEDNKRDAIFLSPADPPRELKRWIRGATLRLTTLERKFWEFSRSARGRLLSEKRHTQRALREEQERRITTAEDARIAAELAEKKVIKRSRIAIGVAVFAIMLFVMTGWYGYQADVSKRETEKALAEAFYHRIGDDESLSKIEEDAIWDLMNVTAQRESVSEFLIQKWFAKDSSPLRYAKNGFSGFRGAATLNGINEFSDNLATKILDDLREKEVDFFFQLSGHVEAIKALPETTKDTNFTNDLLDILIKEANGERMIEIVEAFESIPKSSFDDEVARKLRDAVLSEKTDYDTLNALCEVLKQFADVVMTPEFASQLHDALLRKGDSYRFSFSVDDAVRALPISRRDSDLANRLFEGLLENEDAKDEFITSIVGAIHALPAASIDPEQVGTVRDTFFLRTDIPLQPAIGEVVQSFPPSFLDIAFVESLLSELLDEDPRMERLQGVVEALCAVPDPLKDSALASRLLDCLLSVPDKELYWHGVGKVIKSIPTSSFRAEYAPRVRDALMVEEDFNRNSALVEAIRKYMVTSTDPQFSNDLLSAILIDENVANNRKDWLFAAFKEAINGLEIEDLSLLVDRCIEALPLKDRGRKEYELQHDYCLKALLVLVASDARFPVAIQLWALDLLLRDEEWIEVDDVLRSDIERLSANLGERDLESLVDVLKWPICFGDSMKIVIDAIENSPSMREKDVHFHGNLFTFVDLAPSLGVKNLDTVPIRPSLDAAIKEWKEWEKRRFVSLQETP